MKAVNPTKRPGLKTTKKTRTGRKFILTIHGQSGEDFMKIKSYFESDEVVRACIAKEFGRHKIHPHGQVYFERCNTSTGPVTGRKLMESILGHLNYHIEVAKGSSEANIAYIYAVDKTYEMGFVEYNKNCTIPLRHSPKRVEFWNSFTFRPFQKEIKDLLMNDVGLDRNIFGFYDDKGNTGKTKMMEYLHIFHGAIITGGAAGDMKHAFARGQEITGHNPVFILVNVARSDDFTSASAKALESLKDGLFFSGKYESGMIHARDKAVIAVFSNKEPIINHFSSDRGQIYKIDEKNLKLKKKKIEDFLEILEI